MGRHNRFTELLRQQQTRNRTILSKERYKQWRKNHRELKIHYTLAQVLLRVTSPLADRNSFTMGRSR